MVLSVLMLLNNFFLMLQIVPIIVLKSVEFDLFDFNSCLLNFSVAAKEWINNKYEQTVATSEKYVTEHQRNARLTGLISGVRSCFQKL